MRDDRIGIGLLLQARLRLRQLPRRVTGQGADASTNARRLSMHWVGYRWKASTCALLPEVPGQRAALTGNSLYLSPTSSVTIGGMSVSDNFNRADAGTLGANWTQLEGQLGIVSNWAGGTAAPGGYQWAVYSGTTWGADQSSEIKNDRVAGGAGPIVRAQAGVSGYFLLCNVGPCYIYRRDSGSFTLLQTLGASAVNGDTLKLEITGTTLRAYKNGVQIGTDQDATASGGAITGGSPGIAADSQGGAGGDLLDDWIGTGEVGAAVVILPRSTGCRQAVKRAALR